MKRSTLGRGVVPAALVLSLTLAACGNGDTADDTDPAPGDTAAGDATDDGAADDGAAAEELSGSISGAGASAQEAAQQAWIATYIDVQPGATVNYQSVGSGAGREQFLGGAVQFAGSDAFFGDDEIASAEELCGPDGFVEFPVYISPIAVAYNLEGVDTLNLTPDALAGIFAGEITTWNDPAIAESNPDADLPDTAITPVHRSDDSGTTDNFTEYLSEVAPDVWTYEPDGVWPAEAGGEGAAQTSGVISAVQAGNGYIGYADASQVAASGLASAAIGSEGNFVEYSPEAAAEVVEASGRAEGRPDGSIAIELDREASGYPIVLVSYVMGCNTYEDENTTALVQDYFRYISSEEGQQVSAENAGSAPIGEGLRGDITTIIDGMGGGA